MTALVEVERKREVSDPAALHGRIADLGYVPAGSAVEMDTYYSRPDVDFMATVECLRVRQLDGFAEVTYKPATTTGTPRNGVTAKVETNVLLRGDDQADAANRLLSAVGMVELAVVEKHRTMWHPVGSDNVTVALDQVAGVGVFVEVEVMTRAASLAASLLEAVEDELGITDLPVVSLPYRDLVMQQRSTSARAAS